MSTQTTHQKSRAETNRENAQKSTGPKTEEGKRTSSLNARRHDLTGQIIILPEAQMEEYIRFTSGFHTDKKPQGAIELNLVQQYADVNWRMNHSAAIEKVKLSLTIDDERESVDTECTPAHNSFVEARNYHLYSETLRNISLYETRLSSRAAKLLKQINEIQAERRAREEKEMREAVLMYEMEQEVHEEEQTAAPGKPFTYNPSEDGFVFSIAKIKFQIRFRDRLIVARKCEKARPAAA